MNKLLLLLFPIAQIAIAQPTLNSGNSSPLIGATIPTVSGSYSDSGQLDITGASVEWDYSYLVGGSMNLNIVNPSSTSYGASVPSATHAISYGGTTYDYYKVTSTVFERVASYVNSNYHFDFSNGQSTLEFPFTYQSAFDDTYACTAVVTPDNLVRNGTIDALGDGYGTLILPWGTIEDVLRVKIEETYNDVWNGNDQSSGSQTTYLFFHPGSSYMLFSINIGEFTAPTYTFMGEEVVGVLNGVAEDTQLHSYPNPANNQLNIPVTNSEKDGVIQIHNSKGQLVDMIELNNITAQKYVYDLARLSSDIYSVTIHTDNTSRTERIVVTK